MNIDWWWLPLIALGVIFAFRLVLAPYWMYKDKLAEHSILVRENQTIRAALEKAEQSTYSVVPNMDKWLLQETNGSREYWDGESEGIGFILTGYLTILTFKRIQIESVRLSIGGQLFESDWESHDYVGQDEPSVKFYVPFDTNRGKRTATLQAIVDGKLYTSESFFLNVPLQRKREFRMEGYQP